MNSNQNEIGRHFYLLMNWLEKFIEKAGYFSDWEQRKQIQNNVVVREDMNGPKQEEKLRTFAAVLFGTDTCAYVAETPLKQEKEQLYKWIDATKINKNNCPSRLKLIFYAMNEVIEGRSEKLIREIENRKRVLEPDSPEYQKALEEFFSKLPEYLGKELPMSVFSGNSAQGQKAFQEIIDTVSLTDYENFHWCPQKDEIPLDESPSAQNALQELQKILDEAKKIEENKDSSQTEIEQMIKKLTNFKNNSAANESKNNYAWKKLEGSEEIASLKIKAKINNFKAQHSGKTCGDCKKISDLRNKLIKKERELDVAQRENKPTAEIEKEIAALKAQLFKELTINKNKPIEEKTSNNARYWIIGISVAFLIGLIIAVTAEVIKNRQEALKRQKNRKLAVS